MSVDLRSPSGRLQASFLTEVGMLGISLRHRGEELLAQPVSVESYVETGHVTALPLLHPWANRLAGAEYAVGGTRVVLDLDAANVHTDPSGLPIHGLVAGCRHWELEERSEHRMSARLDYGRWPELRRGFPFPHELVLAAELSDERLRLQTTLTPTSEVAVPVAFGFHPYLRLPGLDRREWWLELPVTSQMELDERSLPTGVSRPVEIRPAPLAERTFDDAFDGLDSPAEFAVSGAGRRVFVRFGDGYRFAQVYAPAGQDVICFEPMTASVNPFESDETRMVEPGAEFRASFEIGAVDIA